MMKRLFAFLIFSAAEIRKDIAFATFVLLTSFLVGFGLSMGAAAFYLLVH